MLLILLSNMQPKPRQSVASPVPFRTFFDSQASYDRLETQPALQDPVKPARFEDSNELWAPRI